MPVNELIDHDVDYKKIDVLWNPCLYDQNQLIIDHIAVCAAQESIGFQRKDVRTSEHEKYLNHGVLELTYLKPEIDP